MGLQVALPVTDGRKSGGSTCQFPPPHPTYAKSVEHRVDRDHREVAHESLGREHPVEWIAVGARQTFRTFGIGDADFQLREALPRDMPRHIERDHLAPRQFANPEPGGDLPGGRRTDHDVVRFVRERIPRRAGKPVTVREPPQKRVGVQQQRHGYPPSHAVSSSSGRGSQKASGTTILPLRMSG